MRKIMSVLGNVLIVFLLVMSLAIMALVLTSQKGEGLPNLKGYSPLAVLSDSMDAAPSHIKKGDMIIIEQRDDYNNLKVDDVVTYYAFIDGQKYFDTHRIVAIEPHNEYNYYVTKGDNVPVEDVEPASFSNIVGVWTGKKVPYLGAVMEFLKTQMGIFICIILPLALLFIWQIYKFIMLLAENKKDKEIEAVTLNLEAEKQKAIEEYKAQQEAQQEEATQAAKAVETVETPPVLTADDIEREKQKAIEEYKAEQQAQEEAAKEAQAAAALLAAEIEREKQKAVEEYIAAQKAAEDATVGNDPCVVPEQTEEPTEPAEPAEPATVGNDPRVVPENVEEAPVAEADSSVPVKEAAREADEVKEQESSDCRDEHCSHEPHEDDENTNENTGEDTNN